MDQVTLDLESDSMGWSVIAEAEMMPRDAIAHFETKAEATRYACVMYCEMPDLFETDNRDILDFLKTI